MKVLDHFSRGIVCVLGIVCLLFLTSAPLAVAQSSFAYPPFPTTGAGAGLSTKGNASAGTGSALQLTSSGSSQVGSAWYVNNAQGNNTGTVSLVNGFNTTFTFQFTGRNINQGSINSCSVPGTPPVGRGGADGIAFVVQNGSFTNGGSGSGSTALGPTTARADRSASQASPKASPFNSIPGTTRNTVTPVRHPSVLPARTRSPSRAAREALQITSTIKPGVSSQQSI